MATRKKPKASTPTEVIDAAKPVAEAYLRAGVPPYEETPKPGWDAFIASVSSVPPTPEETLRLKSRDLDEQFKTLSLSRFNPPLSGDLLAEYEGLRVAGTTKPSQWAEFFTRVARIRAAVPTAPGETGTAPLTRPTVKDGSKWQQ